ncbi:MAG: bacterial Ig-like domain-containing protein [Clostridia bacterium]|nr:bacterial Ig-like domain-containing protein [Clostridia bacterium]
MKKKLMTVLIILILATAMILATACSNGTLFKKNNERDMLQHTAEVTYAGRTAPVTKLDLNATIYNWVYQYYYYYQQGAISQSNYQAILENIATSYQQANESLAESEAYTLKCIDVLYQAAYEKADAEGKAALEKVSTVGKDYNEAERIAEIEAILSSKYLAAARKSYNDEMQSEFDEYREAYETELKNGARTSKSVENVEKLVVTAPAKTVYEKGESVNLNGLKVSVKYENDENLVELERSDYTVTGFDSSAEGKNEVTVTFGSISETFEVEIIAAKPSRPAMPKEDEEEDEEEVQARFEETLKADIEKAQAEDVGEYKILKEAKRRLEKSFESNYHSYEYYYLSSLKTQVVNEVEEDVAEAVKTATLQEITEKYEADVKDQLAALKVDSSSYGDTISGADFATQLVHTDDGYFYVRHVLFKLTDDQKALYDDFKKNENPTNEALEAYLDALVDQMSVYLSNVEYDKDATCEEEDCACKACENYKGTEPGECTDPECACVKCPNKRFVNKDFAENTQKYVSDEGFALDAEKVNEDGTINVHEVIRAMYADLGTVGEDATIEERQAVIDKFEKWIYMCNDDEGFFTTLSDGKVGYALNKNGDNYAKNFASLACALAYGTNAEDWTILGSGIGSYGWCYVDKDYTDNNSVAGIHVVMLVGYAVDADAATEDGDYLISSLDSIADITAYEASEDPTKIAEGTVASYIGKALLEEKQNELKGAFKKAFVQKEIEEAATIKYYEKTYADLIKSYQQ